MLTSSYVNGFGFNYGFGGAPPNILQLIEEAQMRGRGHSVPGRGQSAPGRGLGYYGGLGAPVNDFITFNNGQASPTSFVGGTGSPDVVFCNKDRAFRPQCVLNKAGDAAKAPIRAMQQAIDRIMDLVPAHNLQGRELQGQMPTGDGTTTLQRFTIPPTQRSPIATGGGGGVDGIVGDTTTKFGVLALTLGGMLKRFPNPGISAAFVAPARNDVWAEFSNEIAAYLNDVAENFTSLLAAFAARDNQPIQTQLDVKTIPFVVPLAAQRSNKGLIIGTAVAMVGLTTIAAISAAKKKPVALYEEHYKPALGRRRRRHLAPRGW